MTFFFLLSDNVITQNVVEEQKLEVVARTLASAGLYNEVLVGVADLAAVGSLLIEIEVDIGEVTAGGREEWREVEEVDTGTSFLKTRCLSSAPSQRVKGGELLVRFLYELVGLTSLSVLLNIYPICCDS